MSKMWTKIFRSKSNKLKPRDEVQTSACEYSPGVHRSKFAKVVNSLTLKRHGRSGSIRKVNIENFDRLDDIANLDTKNTSPQSDHSDEFELPDKPVETDIALEPCPICTRTFAPKTLKKHVLICEKTVTKKRKIFDSSRQRREGTDLADFLPVNFGLPPAKQETKASPTEKVMRQPVTLKPERPKSLPPTRGDTKTPAATQRRVTLANIANNNAHSVKLEKIKRKNSVRSKKVTTPVLQRKDVQPVKVVTPTFTPPVTHSATLPPKKMVSPPTNTSSTPKEKPKPVLSRLVATSVPCPHCGRSFGTKAYDRHVEWCKEKTRLANAHHTNLSNVAKERLQARTKYRAPCLKTKRAVNREKYSGLSCEESTNSLSDGGSVGSACKSKEYSQDCRGNMDISMTSSVMSSSILSDGCHDMVEADSTGTFNSGKQPTHSVVGKYQLIDSNPTEAQPSNPILNHSKSISKRNSAQAEISNLTASNKTFTFNSAEEVSCLYQKSSKIPTKRTKVARSQENDEITFKRYRKCDNCEENPQYMNSKEPQYQNQPTSPRNQSIYLTDDEYDNGNDEKFEHYKANPNVNASESEENTPNIAKVKHAKGLIENPKCRHSLKEFIKQKKFDLANTNSSIDRQKTNFYGIPLNHNTQAKIFCDDSLDSSKTGFSHASLSDISSNDLTFSYEEERISENDAKNINEHLQRDGPSPNKSFTIRGLSDKYDPFLSAQRQLEELCSPTDSTPPTKSLPTTPHVKNSPETFMSKSYTGSSAVNKLKNVKSNFHRTLSLRVPRKTTPTRTIFTPSTKPKPTIQRGISDEGPISNNFLKPEEYDEMPVKSVCINDFAANRQAESQSTPKIIRRDPQANRNRRNLKMNLVASVGKKDINPLSKTDSLAVFLHYENATRAPDILPSLTEKDLKDKSNNLSKQTSSKSSASDLDSIFTDKEKLCSLKNSLSNLLDSANTGVDSHLIRDPNPISVTKLQAIKLDPLPKLPSRSERPDFNPFPAIPKENDFIDPKLINVCDNLPINVTKLSDNDLTSSSTESMEKTALQTASRFEAAERLEDNPVSQPIVHRNSTERRNLLKRQLRLGKNQFLYDLSPDNDNYNGLAGKDTSDANTDSNKFETSISSVDPVPDEYDIEEFISSFENAEEYPLFKDYKAFLSNRSLNKLSNNSRESSRSPITPSRNQNDEDDHETEKNEIFSSNESFLKHESEVVPYSTSCHAERDSPNRNVKLTDLNDLNDNICDRQRTVSRSDNEEEVEEEEEDEMNEPDVNRNMGTGEKSSENCHFENITSNHDVVDNAKDLSKPSSLESLEIKKSVSSKQSADSAYGSLSRYSPVERLSRRTSAPRPTLVDPDESQLKIRNVIGIIETNRGSRDLSNDSSSSEVSLSHRHQGRERMLHTPEFGSKQEHRMSKFCHECGSKFIVPQAKFCMECGVKRIVLD